MENEENKTPQEPLQSENHYVERPRWQVWGARVGLVVLLIFLALYYYHISRGGL